MSPNNGPGVATSAEPTYASKEIARLRTECDRLRAVNEVAEERIEELTKEIQGAAIKRNHAEADAFPMQRPESESPSMDAMMAEVRAHKNLSDAARAAIESMLAKNRQLADECRLVPDLRAGMVKALKEKASLSETCAGLVQACDECGEIIRRHVADNVSLSQRNADLEAQAISDAQAIRAAQWQRKKDLAKLEIIGKMAESLLGAERAAVQRALKAGIVLMLDQQVDDILTVLDAPEIPEAIKSRYA